VTDWKPLPGDLCEFINNSTHEITAITRTSHISFKASGSDLILLVGRTGEKADYDGILDERNNDLGELANIWLLLLNGDTLFLACEQWITYQLRRCA
jgi:hypothetical protein